MSTHEFEIIPLRSPNPPDRRKPWFAEIRVVETGKLFVKTTYHATDLAAFKKAEALIATAIETHQQQLAGAAQ